MSSFDNDTDKTKHDHRKKVVVVKDEEEGQ